MHSRSILSSVLGSIAVSLLLTFPLAAQDLEHWTAIEDLRIGSVDDPDLALTWFRNVAIGNNGSMYVPQEMEGRIRVFDGNGRPTGTIGSRGEGPGEFQSIASLGWIGDTLYANDFRQHRISFFTAEGEFLESRSLTPAGLAYPLGPGNGEPLTDGSILLYTSAPSNLIADGEFTRLPILRLNRDGSVRDTAAWRPVGHDTWRIRLPENVMSFRRPPWNDEVILAVTADRSGLIRIDRPAAPSGREATVTIERVDLDGEVEWQRSINYTPVPLSKTDVDEFLAARVDDYVGTEGRSPRYESRSEATAAMRDELFVPDFYPPVSSFLQGRDGSLWLAREARPDQSRLWLIFNPSADLIATLELSGDLRVMAADLEHVWTIEFDELDVPYLVRYRIQRE